MPRSGGPGPHRRYESINPESAAETDKLRELEQRRKQELASLEDARAERTSPVEFRRKSGALSRELCARGSA